MRSLILRNQAKLISAILPNDDLIANPQLDLTVVEKMRSLLIANRDLLLLPSQILTAMSLAMLIRP